MKAKTTISRKRKTPRKGQKGNPLLVCLLLLTNSVLSLWGEQGTKVGELLLLLQRGIAQEASKGERQRLLLQRAELEEMAGLPARAAEDYAELARSSQGERANMYRLREWRVRFEMGEADLLSRVEGFLVKNPDAVEFLLLKARILRDKGRLQEASALIEAEKESPLFALSETYHFMWEIYTSLGERDKAGRMLSLFQERFPDSVTLRLVKRATELLPEPSLYLGRKRAHSGSTHVQTGAFRSLKNALTHQNELANLGYFSYIQEEGKSYKVVVYSSDEASQLTQELKKRGFTGFILRP